MKSRPYYEQIDIENTTKLRELTAALPPFVNDSVSYTHLPP